MAFVALSMNVPIVSFSPSHLSSRNLSQPFPPPPPPPPLSLSLHYRVHIILPVHYRSGHYQFDYDLAAK